MNHFPSFWRNTSQDPFRAMQREMNELFNHFSEMDLTDLNSCKSTGAFLPHSDLEELDSYYLLSMDLPGIEKNDIKIEVNGSQLRVFGERKFENQESKKNIHRSERSYGMFERTMTLPQKIDAEQVEAHLENGVLKIAIPKKESLKAKPISLSENKSGFFSKLFGKKDSSTSTKIDSAEGQREKIA